MRTRKALSLLVVTGVVKRKAQRRNRRALGANISRLAGQVLRLFTRS